MNHDAITEYVVRLLDRSDEYAFHSLIEEGDSVIDVVCRFLSICNNEQFKRLVEVLQEIRTDKSSKVLIELCELPYSERWVIAAEGMFYNNSDLAQSVFEKMLLAGNLERAKSLLIETLLRIGR